MANSSQIRFARAVVRFAIYAFAFDAVPVIWAICTYVVGIPSDWFWPSLWGMLIVWLGGLGWAALAILIPALRARARDQDQEKGRA